MIQSRGTHNEQTQEAKFCEFGSGENNHHRPIARCHCHCHHSATTAIAIAVPPSPCLHCNHHLVWQRWRHQRGDVLTSWTRGRGVDTTTSQQTRDNHGGGEGEGDGNGNGKWRAAAITGLGERPPRSSRETWHILGIAIFFWLFYCRSRYILAKPHMCA